MTAGKCVRCHHWWSFEGRPELFAVIGKWCPDCIAKCLPEWGKS